MMPTSDELLDEALRLTFPASDPIAVRPDEPRLKLVVFGSSGELGARIASIAAAHGHEVTLAGPATDAKSVSAAARGADAAIAALNPCAEAQMDAALREAAALADGLRDAGVPRVLVASETGTLDAKVLARYRTADLNWTYLSPAALPGADPHPDETVAIAVLEELERPRYSGQRMTVS